MPANDLACWVDGKHDKLVFRFNKTRIHEDWGPIEQCFQVEVTNALDKPRPIYYNNIQHSNQAEVNTGDGSGSQPEAESRDNGMKSCSVCTYDNEKTATVCEICQTPF
jgi:hypothetical protein